jgi:succinyl-CoA synthetase beta subunit
MATMDMIKRRRRAREFPRHRRRRHTRARRQGLRLVLSDERVEAILVNIFAGINRCDWVAQGIVQALQKVEMKVPLVVRLAGTHVEEGRRILEASSFPIIAADSLADAADKVVAAWQRSQSAKTPLRAAS